MPPVGLPPVKVNNPELLHTALKLDKVTVGCAFTITVRVAESGPHKLLTLYFTI